MKKISFLSKKVNKAMLPLFLLNKKEYSKAILEEKEQLISEAYNRQSDFFLFFTLFGLFLSVSLCLRMILLF